MHMKVPNFSGNNSFLGSDSYDENTSDYEETEVSDTDGGVGNDFSDFLWMENEDEFEIETFKKFEEEELMNDCMEAMGEMALLDEIKQVEAEHNIGSNENLSSVAQKSNLNPEAKEFIPEGVH